jgi:hypothetical protein
VRGLAYLEHGSNDQNAALNLVTKANVVIPFQGEELMSEPKRSRAVFSTEDFRLIRDAVAHYTREVQDKPESVQYANLYHRLGSLVA